MKRLTPRQLAVAQQLLLGRTTTELAHALGISPTTARAHRRAVFIRLRVRDMAGFLAYAKEVGLQ